MCRTSTSSTSGGVTGAEGLNITRHISIVRENCRPAAAIRAQPADLFHSMDLKASSQFFRLYFHLVNLHVLSHLRGQVYVNGEVCFCTRAALNVCTFAKSAQLVRGFFRTGGDLSRCLSVSHCLVRGRSLLSKIVPLLPRGEEVILWRRGGGLRERVKS